MRPDWNKITEDAFSSGEEHMFSESYCRRRAELQGGINMEKRRKIQRTRRFNAGVAATAAAFVMIPAATIGVLHFTGGSSSDNGNGQKLGAAVSDSTDTTAYTKPAETTLDESTVTTEATTALEIATIDVETPVVQDYYKEYALLRTDYVLNYDNVPSIFTRPDGFKFYYNDGQKHSGGITPCGLEVCTDIEAFKKEAFNTSTYSSNHVDNYKLEKDGMEWDIYVSYRNLPDNGSNGEGDAHWAFDRDVVIKFGDTGYAEHLYIYSEITETDMKAFIEGMQLVKQPEGAEKEVPYDGTLSMDLFDRTYMKKVDGVQVEYNFLPDGYSFAEAAIEINMVDFAKNDEERIQPVISEYLVDANNGAEKAADTFFDANAVSRNGRVEQKSLDGKTVYINYRKEGPCEGETEEGWQHRLATDWYDRDGYVAFDGTGYGVEFCVFHEVSDEELMQFIDGMNLK